MGHERNIANRLRSFGCFALICFCFLLLSAHQAFGQADEGAISGTVQDTTGAVVAGAHVSLLNTDQGITLEANANGNGAYTFSPVRIGHYSITVTAKGFATTTQENITVNVDQHLQVNVQLKPGAATETVEVSTAPPLMQTDEASVGQVITEQSVNGLPLNGRNFTFLAQLGAGTQTPQADTRGNAASGAFSANGLRPSQNNYLLDGIDNNSNAVDFLNGTNFIVLPPVDAIEEFKVQTADFSAELGRSAGAVLNASIKSGTNSFHGAVWEFFRNDKLDAANWFENNGGTPRAELRLNQFRASGGGPILKNKIFFFGDYEGLRRVFGTTQSGAVPTAAEVSSGFTDLSDMVQSGTQTDLLGRTFKLGTVMDPATTRFVANGTVDSVSGLANNSGTDGYARDPIGCSPGFNPATGTCNYNQIPVDRIDPVALKLMSLYPGAQKATLSNNFTVSPNLFEHRNAFDVRGDVNPTQKDQAFVRVSYVDDPQYIPGIFGGIADGGGFQQGLQTALSTQTAGAWTHVFTPETINVGRVGFNHLHTTRYGPDGGVSGIPAQYGIQGIPQFAENGGLPSMGIGGLQTLGSNAFLPSDEISQTLQITDDFTKIWGKHSFKTGIEYQHVKFSTLQPGYSRGNFDYNGTYTDVPQLANGGGGNNGNTGRAQFLISPMASPYSGEGGTGLDFSGGSDSINASNINKTYDAKNYFAAYVQDDWKVSPKLTLNLGLRWDYFGPIQETNGGQANFVQSGGGFSGPTFLIPASGKDVRTLSTSFTTLAAQDGITILSTDKYGKGLLQVQKTNFAPRVGFAYQANNKLVVRGGFGMFYNAFENQGYGPNIGENYPFVFNFSFSPQVGAGAHNGQQGVSPISYNTPWAGCSTAGPGGTATIAAGLSCVAFTPTAVDAQGLGLQGLQFNYVTPRTYSANLTTQYSLTRTLSIQAGYVFTHGEDLQAGIGNNSVSQILASGTSTSNYVPFPDFSHGGSYQQTVGSSTYNGLQTKLEQQFNNGLTYLLAYTWSKTYSDAGDLLNGGSVSGYRAPWVPGLGVNFDRGLADFNIVNVFHFSGGYELPFGKGKKFLNTSNKVENAVLGGWAVNWIAAMQGGQPITLGCNGGGGAAGLGCNALRVPGQSAKLGITKDTNNLPRWFGNAAAFTNPATCTSNSGCTSAVLGGGPATTIGPGLHNLDFSAFKGFQLSDRFSMQFRMEVFNIVNHPNFNAPGFGGNGVVSISGSTNFTTGNFGEIGSTRTDPREAQFALKLYY
jgi:hypothetical protein